jgi:hypothetical protein
MGCSPSPPPAPDYTGAANATAAGNLANLQYQTAANRVNTNTPLGSTSWTQNPATFDQSGYQSALNAWQSGGQQGAAPTQSQFTNPTWSENETLTPQAQAALNSQLGIQQNQSSLANTLQGQVASTMASGFKGPDYSSYMSGVAPVQQNFAGYNNNTPVNTNFSSFNGTPNQNANFSGFTPSGVNAVNQNSYNAMDVTNGVQGINQTLNTNGTNVNLNSQSDTGGAGQVNPNAPQFNQGTANAGTQAAFNSSFGLIQPLQQQDTTNLDSQLRLQGLTPGSQAYNDAMQNLSRTQAQQNDQLANSSVLTGNQEANANYASTLAGYNSGNAAQNQAFSQGIGTFDANNTAAGQQFNQNTGAMAADNASRTQALQNNEGVFNTTLAGQSAYNTAQGQAYGQALSGYGADQSAQLASNSAAATAYQQALSGYGANQTAQQASNAAVGQQFGQNVGAYGLDQAAQQASNAAQAQQFGQGIQGYDTAYNAAYQNYLQPLNSMNAVLSGQQVNVPGLQTPNTTAGYVPGADQSGATAALGSWNQGIYNTQVGAANSQTQGIVGGVAAAGTIAAIAI